MKTELYQFGCSALLPIVSRVNWLRGGIVLTYHSIKPEHVDELSLTLYERLGNLAVEEKHFEQQMRYLAANFECISLLDMLRKDPQENTGCVSVTFDDGYLDNLTCAAPILEKFGVPASFFSHVIFVWGCNALGGF